jgi:PAS domain S-box-containing protein
MTNAPPTIAASMASPIPHPADHPSDAAYSYAVDSGRLLVAVSEGLADLLGYRSDEMIGRAAAEFIVREDREKCLELCEERRATSTRLHLLRKDGGTVSLTVKRFPVERRTGVVELHGVVLDDECAVVQLSSGDAAVAISDTLRVLSWNAAAEKLTGRAGREAVGRLCWEVVRASGEDGEPLCGADCAVAHNALSGAEVERRQIMLDASGGKRRVTMSTVTVELGERKLVLHSFPAAKTDGSAVELTRRQQEILGLLDQGLTTRQIAERLVLSTTTVRNHIQAILRALDCHSRLEALAEARRLGLL